jgi:hypothetical protein
MVDMVESASTDETLLGKTEPIELLTLVAIVLAFAVCKDREIGAEGGPKDFVRWLFLLESTSFVELRL